MGKVIIISRVGAPTIKLLVTYRHPFLKETSSIATCVAMLGSNILASKISLISLPAPGPIKSRT